MSALNRLEELISLFGDSEHSPDQKGLMSCDELIDLQLSLRSTAVSECLDVFEKICQVLPVSAEWLLRGQGSPLLPNQQVGQEYTPDDLIRYIDKIVIKPEVREQLLSRLATLMQKVNNDRQQLKEAFEKVIDQMDKT